MTDATPNPTHLNTISGIVHRIIPEDVGTFQKVTVVIIHDTYAPLGGEAVQKFAAIEFFGPKVHALPDDGSLVEGAEVSIGFRISAREWSGPKGVKWFPALNGNSLDVTAPPAAAAGSAMPPPDFVDEDDDASIPF